MSANVGAIDNSLIKALDRILAESPRNVPTKYVIKALEQYSDLEVCVKDCNSRDFGKKAKKGKRSKDWEK